MARDHRQRPHIRRALTKAESQADEAQSIASANYPIIDDATKLRRAGWEPPLTLVDANRQVKIATKLKHSGLKVILASVLVALKAFEIGGN